MKKYSATYHVIFKSVAFLLLMAFLLPTGLQAKQLVDFCAMEMSSHHLTDARSSHDCCESEKEPADHHQTQDCDQEIICACNTTQHFIDDNYIPTVRDAAVKPDVTVNITPFFTIDELFRQDLQIRIGQYSPALYLLYDTFLM